ncbi:hypothetical protein [Sphingobacterium haloxyli]|uniref:Uncharacterized protein n=1 Tax=Sphingobacterium haloxyli TaxID=2100533 RepID=A0A2S9J3R0_9SPHI|nr:hypothetical protein [Sphingobacterium haloxyli]PRD47436.1 hypothetical protein C5745_08910 [Sphingobacterium haloxyli]
MRKLTKQTKINIAIGITLASIVLVACNGESASSSTDNTDSLLHPAEDSGVPLNYLERNKDPDTVDQKIENNSGVPLNNLNRDNSYDTISSPDLD